MIIFREKLQNADAQFNDNGTITFVQLRGLEFVPELSVGDPNVDWLISPNIPLVVSIIILPLNFINVPIFTYFTYSKIFVSGYRSFATGQLNVR